MEDHARLQRYAFVSSRNQTQPDRGWATSDQVGCVRRLTLAQGFVQEGLLCMDDRNYIFTYEIVEGILPVRGYVAGVRLHRVMLGNRTFAEWWGWVDT
jgi:hypothetical protein